MIDIRGQKFGRLEAIEPIKTGSSLWWRCKCECGNCKDVSGTKLRNGHTKSCGCYRRDVQSDNGKRTINELYDKVFGRWRVIDRAGTRNGQATWNCECACGIKKVVYGGMLISGRSQSCGCLAREKGIIANNKHGECKADDKSNEWKIWRGMIKRCYTSTNRSYPNYGGRGIKVCDRWLHSFETFLEDMGRCPEGMFLEKINNNGDYCKENCRWATHYDQCRNKRTNVWVEVDGERMILMDAIRLLHINSRSFYSYKNNHDLTHQETIDHFSNR